MPTIMDRYPPGEMGENYFINESTGEVTYLPGGSNRGFPPAPGGPERPPSNVVSPGRRLEDPMNVLGYGRTGQLEDPFGIMPGIERGQYSAKQAQALKVADYLAQFLPPERLRGEVYKYTGVDLGGNITTPNLEERQTNVLKREDLRSQITSRGVTAEENLEDIAKKRQERRAAPVEARSSFENATLQLDRMAEEAGKIQNNESLWRAVGLVGWAPNIPGSAAADVTAQIKSLESQVGFSVLQAMRDASKTGGALGNVSNVELELLKSNLAALASAQSPAQYRQSLGQIVDYTQRSKERLERAFLDTYPTQFKRADVGDQPPAAARSKLREGTVTTFGNGQQWTLRGGKPTRVK